MFFNKENAQRVENLRKQILEELGLPYEPVPLGTTKATRAYLDAVNLKQKAEKEKNAARSRD